MQHYLNSKGVCTWMDPRNNTDTFKDIGYELTFTFNDLLHQNVWLSEGLQALSSFSIDISILYLLYNHLFGIFSSTRAALSFFFFLIFRFVAQISATIPCAPGFMWPRGKLLGYEIPTLVVDYHPANDMFFSGHAGTIVVASIEYYKMAFTKLAAFHLLIMFPFVSILVITFRVHRGIDVIAAVYAAIAACSVAEKCSGIVDGFLKKRTHTFFI